MQTTAELQLLLNVRDEASKQLKGIAGHLGDVAKIAGGFVIGQGLAALPGLVAGLISDASDANETLSKSNTVFKDNAREIEAWARGAARDFGQSKTQALDAASTFGNMFTQIGIGTPKAAEMSRAMTELASDFASFHNADITEVIQAQTAAFRGEYDALQRYVPTINAAAVETQALAETGKKNAKELTAQEKAAATYTLMMQGAGEALGDFDRTSDGLANRQRILSAEFANMKTQLGQELLPVAVAAAGFMLDTMIPAVQKFAAELSQQLRPSIQQVVAFVKEHWPEISAVIAFAVDFARTKIEGLIQMVEAIVEIVTSVVNLVSALVHGDWSRAWSELKDIAGAAVDLLLGQLKWQFGSIPGIIWDAIGDAVAAAIEMGRRMGGALSDALKGGLNYAVTAINRLIGAWNGLSFRAGGGSVLGVDLPSVEFGTPDLGYIPYLASGGIVTKPTLAMIGENGDEAVVPLDGRHGIGGNVTVNINAPVYGVNDLDRVIVAAVQRAARGGEFSGYLGAAA